MRERGAKPEPRACFKRLETDAEFRARLTKQLGDSFAPYLTGEELDDVVWKHLKIQRRIVEDVA